MKLVTFVTSDGHQRLGALTPDDRIADLASIHEANEGQSHPALTSMLALIEGGPAALELARKALGQARTNGTTYAPQDVRLLAPLPLPTQIRDFLCFELHLKQSMSNMNDRIAAATEDPEATKAEMRAAGRYDVPQIWYDLPLHYKGNRMSVIGPDEDVIWPAYSEVMDYELEFAAVIGEACCDVPKDQALGKIFGYTIFNDFTARDAQGQEMPGMLGPAKGKDFDTSNALGPCIVTADEIDPYALTMISRINGEEQGRGSSSTMHHTLEDVIAYVSRSQTLYPGEILGSGTVGNGCGMETGRLLQPDDIIELEIEGIGVLRNRIVRKGVL